MNTRMILIVDDEPTSLELMDYILRKNHFKTILASKADEAFGLLKDQRPDLIILDLIMPDMHGTEICKKLKSDPATKDIPVLFVSAMVAEKEIEAGFKAGAAGYIFKPFETSAVLAKIEEILKT